MYDKTTAPHKLQNILCIFECFELLFLRKHRNASKIELSNAVMSFFCRPFQYPCSDDCKMTFRKNNIKQNKKSISFIYGWMSQNTREMIISSLGLFIHQGQRCSLFGRYHDVRPLANINYTL